MPDLILHHYPMSPFSQKVRSMLGHAGLPWFSVIARESPPRPHLAALAGGYRRIPVAQDGADVFCDSRIIAEEIAERAGRPELALARLPPEQQAWVRRVDQDLFFPCVLAAGNRTLRRKARESMTLPELLRFAWDRLNLGRTSATPIPSLRAARPMVLAHAAVVEDMLARDFLFGAAPTHADFSTWHGLWMIRELAESGLLRDFPRLNAWLDRMKALGEGVATPMACDDALAIARQSAPRPVPVAALPGERIGQAVAIAPDDYGQVPTTGVLVGETPTRWVIARDHDRVGRVHVHFPREGYALRPQRGR